MSKKRKTAAQLDAEIGALVQQKRILTDHAVSQFCKYFFSDEMEKKLVNMSDEDIRKLARVMSSTILMKDTDKIKTRTGSGKTVASKPESTTLSSHSSEAEPKPQTISENRAEYNNSDNTVSGLSA